MIKRHKQNPNAFCPSPNLLKSTTQDRRACNHTKNEQNYELIHVGMPSPTVLTKDSSSSGRGSSSSTEIDIFPCGSEDESEDDEQYDDPIITFTEATNETSSRQTLSSVGQLSIVELNFLDDSTIKSIPPSSFPSRLLPRSSSKDSSIYSHTKTTSQGNKNSPGFYQSRKKIISPVSDSRASKKTTQQWKSTPVYQNMDRYFLIGVPEAKMFLTPNTPDVSPEDNLTNGLVNEQGVSKILITSASDNDNDNVWTQEQSYSKFTERKDSNHLYQRGSYDFMHAPPPLSKGDNFLKLHRASTSLTISAMPIDVWQDSDVSQQNSRCSFYMDNPPPQLLPKKIEEEQLNKIINANLNKSNDDEEYNIDLMKKSNLSFRKIDALADIVMGTDQSDFSEDDLN